METGSEGHLPFLGSYIYRRPDGSLGHKEYRKPTHTDLYLNDNTSTRCTVYSGARARALSDEDSLQAQLVFLRDIFKQNGYNDWRSHRALNRRRHLNQPNNDPNSVAVLPFVGTVFNHVSKVLARHNIKSVGLSRMKLSSLLRPVKDRLGLGTPGVYRILCERGKVYTGQTGCFVDIRLREHQRHIRLEHRDKSAAAENSIDQGRYIQFYSSSILATKTRHMCRIVMETIESELRFCLGKSWRPLISSEKLSGHDPGPLGDAVPYAKAQLFKQSPYPFHRSYGISLCSLAK
jgi:hypothetical protein